MARKKKRAISMGIELESYSISLPEYRISRELKFPRRGIAEAGERFTKDVSIGSEYNSKVFYTIREAFFLLKSGLRKYIYFRGSHEREIHTLFLVGGWTDRFAGTHIHLATGKRKFQFREAKSLAKHLHDHIPYIIVLCANSPVWRQKINNVDSNRILRGSKTYCQVAKRGVFSSKKYRELTFNPGRRRKPPTLELRVLDASVPEYIVAALCIASAVALRWLSEKSAINQLKHENYLSARDQASREGTEAKLFWNNHEVTVAQYTDLFFRKYEEELAQMDIPDDVINVFKYLKKGWNQADLIRKAAQKCLWTHRPTWQRRFAKKYAHAIQLLLDGNSYAMFAKALGVRLPKIERTWLGRKEAKW